MSFYQGCLRKQMLQNAAAHILSCTFKFEQISLVLALLSWLILLSLVVVVVVVFVMVVVVLVCEGIRKCLLFLNRGSDHLFIMHGLFM